MNNQTKTLLLKRKEKAAELAKVKDDLAILDSELRVTLFSLVPDELKELVENESIVRVLVEHGSIATCLRLNDHGLKTKRTIQSVIEKLLMAWDGIVVLHGGIDSNEPHRISFTFALASPERA